MNKHLFCIAGIICLVGLQVAAWVLNKNGTITGFVFAGIGALIVYGTGKGLNIIKQKKQED
jgi:hypothetical protein